MIPIDGAIQDVSRFIDESIERINSIGDRAFHCQGILKVLRDLVEYVAQKIYIGDSADPNDYQSKQGAKRLLKVDAKHAILRRFLCQLTVSASHYTRNKDEAERLILKYCDSFEYSFVGGYVYDCKKYMKKRKWLDDGVNGKFTEIVARYYEPGSDGHVWILRYAGLL